MRRHIFDLARGLRDLGFVQSVAYSPAGADGAFLNGMSELERTGVTFVPFPLQHRVGLADVGAVYRLRGELRRLRPDVLHLHSSKAGAVGRLAAIGAFAGAVVYTPHAMGSHVGWHYGAVEWVLGRLTRATIVAVSPSEYDELRRWRVSSAARLRQITSGIDVEEVERLSRDGDVAPEPVDVSVCGRISRQKDPLTVARASARVISARPDTRFRWIGDGDMRVPFERVLARAGIRDHWSITGWVKSAYGYLAATRVLWLASLYESFGYATLEGMALGVPTIGTHVAGTRDLIVDGETGFLVPVGDASALAERTLTYLSDPSLQKSFSERARARCVRFTNSGMIRETAALYLLLHEGRTSGLQLP
ncbi:MAG: glycosyltransferase [Deltaproteobacteria bacterium]|nr:glycosyltransferase [Deltaproteobacteria bacterium]